MKFESVINEFVERCKEKFKGNLISVVLFGSVAKGSAERYSDIDLLVVINGLPHFNKRIPLISEICYKMLIKHKVSISPILLTPEEFDKNVTACFPLFLGVITGYKAVFDKTGFSNRLLTGFSDTLNKGGAIFKDGVWTVPSMALKRQDGHRMG